MPDQLQKNFMTVFASLQKVPASYIFKINNNIPITTYVQKQVPIQHETHLVLKQIDNVTKLHESECYHCVECKLTVSQVKFMMQHKCTPVRTNTRPRLLCQYCGSEHSNEYNLGTHESCCSQNIPCTICTKRLRPDKYQSHMQWCKSRMNNGKNKDILNCSVCEKKFPDDNNYKLHREECHGKFRCPHCNAEKRGLKSIKTHIDNCPNRYTCAICSTKCKTRDELNGHVTTVHNLNN